MHMQVVMQFPVLGLVDVLYQQHLNLANGVLDAAISLAGIYFSFVLMPAMDAVLGTDLHPKTLVSTAIMPFSHSQTCLCLVEGLLSARCFHLHQVPACNPVSEVAHCFIA